MDPNEFDERQSFLLPTSSSSKAFNYRRLNPMCRPLENEKGEGAKGNKVIEYQTLYEKIRQKQMKL